MGSLIDQLLSLLTDQNLRCMKAFPTTLLPRMSAPMIVLRRESERVVPAVLADRFSKLKAFPCFGGTLEGVVVMEIYAPYKSGGRVCQEMQNTALMTVKNQWRALGVREVSLTPVFYDSDADFFRCEVRLTVRGCILRDDMQ